MGDSTSVLDKLGKWAALTPFVLVVVTIVIAGFNLHFTILQLKKTVETHVVQADHQGSKDERSSLETRLDLVEHQLLQLIRLEDKVDLLSDKMIRFETKIDYLVTKSKEK